jgi:AraC-like DNA-binding protein
MSSVAVAVANPSPYFCSHMTSLDALLSGISIALFLLLAAFGLRDGAGLPQARALAMLAISVSAQAIASLPLARLFPLPLYAALRLVGAPNVGLLWWFCLVLLRDDFRRNRLEWAGLLTLSAAPAIYLLSELGMRAPRLDLVSAYGSLVPLLMVAHVMWVALRERGGDLLEPRRRARRWIVAACLFALVVSLGTEELADGQLASVLRNALVGVPVTGAVLLWLTRLRTEHLQFIERVDCGHAERGGMDPRDIALHRRLLHAMETERCYLRPGLTIDALAEHLRTPVQPLRALIHTGMGHRNFTAFVNHYRLAHARTLLADPERARETVLSIALGAGFASLATFNRVFRDVEGCTPTEYRTTALARLVTLED